jgi:Zn-dependent protease/CBS domain-containing protein
MTITRTPGTAPAPNETDPGQDKRRPRFGGIAVRVTAGGYVLATLAALVGALRLPSAAPGWQPAAYVAAAAAIAILLTASLAGHELAHGLAARRHGVDVSEITIGFAGGTWHGRNDLAGPGAAGQVAVAGPAASFILAGISAAVAAGLSAWGIGRLVMLVFATIAAINALYGGLSLLPGPGSDGGRIIRAVVWARTGDPARASLIAARTGQATGAALAAAGLTAIVLGQLVGVGVAFIGFLVMVTSRSQARQLLTRAVLSGLRVRDILPPHDPSATGVQAWLTVQSFVDGQVADGSRARATAFPLHDLEGKAAGLVTMTQLAAVPPERRAEVRLSDAGTHVSNLVTTTADELLTSLLERMSARPASPAGLLTIGHALVLAPDGTLGGVITPADMARAGQLGLLRNNAAKS